ncbi:glycosyltransferase family 2 protein [Aquabacter sp. L1I39]|uniref:glycosyltransferase family 2 protein n=1 Tax=Aquabacter sp. L1I39 TaxID=2820278 RepID=UPI001ADBB5F3|nr:glycosyltransferase family 2 protein [Aquabacter sp. L1I39]QTL05411.1 glycosyltransferase family 2 protein [Aquabacter sp. L1I39]
MNVQTALAPAAPRYSVVIAVRDEVDNVAPLIDEIEATLPAGTFELVFVDDGSIDGTDQVLLSCAQTRPNMLIITHAKPCGKSAGVDTGVWAARGDILLLLDGDGQNNPAYFPQMIELLDKAGTGAGMVQGERVGRKDTPFKRFQSRLANAVRSALLRDGTRDTGCGLKVVYRDVYLRLPFFDALHRFTPALVRREGLDVLTFPVVDRARWHGQSKYGFWNRLWVGIVDLLGVWWLTRRRRVPKVVRVYPDAR